MMYSLILMALSISVIDLVAAGQMNVINNCRYTVWVGTNGQREQDKTWSHPERGGFELKSRQRKTLNVEVGWAGRVWGRTNCDGQGRCETGNCWNGIQCNGQSGSPPATLAEFKFDGWDGLDFYDVSLVDGFNLPMRLVAPNGCKEGSCTHDMRTDCPNELRTKNGRGQTVGCDSKGGTQSFRDYARRVCPNAYGYWNDDTKTYSCRPSRPGGSVYDIIFC